MNIDEFADRVVLVTGAGDGPGRQVALAFAALGAYVAANDINPTNLDETVSQVMQAGGNARPYVFDIAKRMPIEGMVSQVLDHFGRIDILVNRASVEPHASLLEMDEWDFHRTLDVNLGGAFFCMQQVGRAMRQQGSGAMVNIVSFGSWQETSGRAAFLASQAGLAGLTRAAAGELLEHNIRLNAVCDCAQAAAWPGSPDWDDELYQRWRDSLPPGYAGDQQSLASLVLFLCSSAASSLTGQVISASE